jgi:hypothetical protein
MDAPAVLQSALMAILAVVVAQCVWKLKIFAR